MPSVERVMAVASRPPQLRRQNPPTAATGPLPKVDSSAWTGLPSNFTLAAEKQTRLAHEIDVAETALAKLDLGQEVTCQARAYFVAARLLAEAPEPDYQLIWFILERLSQLAGVAGLIVSIVALFRP